MKCDQIARLIEDYHYGELEKTEAAEVAGHLQDCASCRQQLASLESEARIYETYAARTESALEVSPDLWKRTLEGPAVASAKAQRTGGVRWLSALVPASSWARQAIAAMLLVAVSVTGTLLIVEHYRSREALVSQQVAAQAGMSGGKGLEDALQSIQRAEQEYLKAIQQLNAIVEKQKSSLDPRIYAEVQVNLRLIDDHIAATRNAYYAHPQDAELALYMLAAYSRKVALLQDLTS